MWAVFEYALILGFCIAAIVGIYSGGLHHTVHIASSWFTIGGAGGFKALISGSCWRSSCTRAGTPPPT